MPLGYAVRAVPGAGHFAPYDDAEVSAALLRDVVR